ncbi:MAG: hypothetical protein GXO42_02495 [bacterium]|nr:hypothetical protein [bacterium]
MKLGYLLLFLFSLGGSIISSFFAVHLIAVQSSSSHRISLKNLSKMQKEIQRMINETRQAMEQLMWQEQFQLGKMLLNISVPRSVLPANVSARTRANITRAANATNTTINKINNSLINQSRINQSNLSRRTRVVVLCKYNQTNTTANTTLFNASNSSVATSNFTASNSTSNYTVVKTVLQNITQLENTSNASLQGFNASQLQSLLL